MQRIANPAPKPFIKNFNILNFCKINRARKQRKKEGNEKRRLNKIKEEKPEIKSEKFVKS